MKVRKRETLKKNKKVKVMKMNNVRVKQKLIVKREMMMKNNTLG